PPIDIRQVENKLSKYRDPRNCSCASCTSCVSFSLKENCLDVLKIPRDIVAIDCHVHPNTKEHEKSDGEYVAVAKKYFKTDVGGFVSFDEMADLYRSKKMMCVLLGKDARTNTGLPPITNDSIAEAVHNHPDTFIGFGAVDPYMGKWAAEEVHRIAELGLRGL